MRIYSFILLFVISIVVSSCKKENAAGSPNQNNTDTFPADIITATIDDSDYTFNYMATAAYAEDSSNNPFTNFEMGGFLGTRTAGSQSSYLNLNIAYTDSMTTGNYLENQSEKDGGMAYSVNSSLVYYSTFSGSSSNPFTIVVDSIHTLFIQGDTVLQLKGTFQGNIYLNGDSTQDLKVVTNGRFSVINY